MRDELLNETLFLSLDHARAVIAAELNMQWPASLRPKRSATQSIASTALMSNNAARL